MRQDSVPVEHRTCRQSNSSCRWWRTASTGGLRVLSDETLCMLHQALAELGVAMLVFDQLHLLQQHARVNLRRSLQHL